eukprot:m.191886 g.191886  ORF g.191886 m.191886 type:complete len:707 (+) comp32447_c0_seq1:79-2199(+)
MDFSAFSEATFEPKSWVNAALKPEKREPNQTADQHASGIVMKLQMFIQEVNNSLETTSLQVVQDMPRVIRGVDMVHQEVQLLKERITSLSDEIAKIEHDTSQSMELLMQFDDVKSRMEATSGALQEADNWDTLIADVDLAFSEDDVAGISNALLGLRRSLMVLTAVPDYADRQTHLATLQDNFGAMLSPMMVKAFANHDTELAKECVLRLKDIDRDADIQTHYHQCHSATAQNKWTTLSQNLTDPLPAALRAYYADMLTMWREELEWGAQVFTDDVQKMFEGLMVKMLDERVPVADNVIKEDVGQGSDQLARLVALFVESLSFSDALQPCDAAVTQAVLKPFFPYQRRYKTLQSLELQQTLPSFHVQDSLPTWVEQIKDSVPVMFDNANKAVDRCIEFTGGTAFAGLVSCLNTYFVEYTQRLQGCVPHLRGIIGRLTQSAQEEDDDDDWAASTSLFKLIETCGQVSIDMAVFETTLIERFRNIATASTSSGAVMYLETHDEENFLNSHLTTQMNDFGATPLSETMSGLKKFNFLLHSITFETVLSPLKHKLSNLKSLGEWSAKGEPDAYSLSPLPYVTKIGEQLLTLPQQLEPFSEHVSDDTPDYLLVALNFGNLPQDLSGNSIESVVDHWLDSVAKSITLSYIAEIKTIPTLSAKGGSQLCADIEYICNVMDSLEVEPLDDLLHISKLSADPKCESLFNDFKSAN